MPLDEDGLYPGLWLRRQRRNKAQLSQGQIERLERIGVEQGQYADAAWEKGRLGMRAFARQRNWKSGKLCSPERCEWLADIGMFRGRSRS